MQRRPLARSSYATTDFSTKILLAIAVPKKFPSASLKASRSVKTRSSTCAFYAVAHYYGSLYMFVDRSNFCDFGLHEHKGRL